MIRLLALAALAAASVVAVRRTLILTTVDGPSMEPSLHDGDRVLIRRTRRVRRGQIALLHSGDTLLLKRAVAVPGDHLPKDWADPDVKSLADTIVPPGMIVVLGDNRPTSWDSRHFGHVPQSRLVGVLLIRLP